MIQGILEWILSILEDSDEEPDEAHIPASNSREVTDPIPFTAGSIRPRCYSMPEQEKIDAAYGRVGSSMDPNASGTRALISQPPRGHGAIWNAQVRLSGYSRSPSPENEGIAWAGGRARVFKIPSGFSEYYRDKIVWGYNPVDFLLNVWGFDPTSLSSGPHLLSDTPHTGLYALPSDKLLFYCKAHQENAYQYLRDLINVLKVQLFGWERDTTSRQNFRGTTVNCVQTLKKVVSRSVLCCTEKKGDYKGAASLPQQVEKHLVVIEGCDGQEGEAPTKPYMVLASGKDSRTHSWTWSLAPIHVRKATSPWRWKDDELRINLDGLKTRYREDHPAETEQAGQKRRRDANTDTESLGKPNKKRVLATLERLVKEDGSCQREAPRRIHVVWPSSSSSPDGPDATCTKSFERYEKEILKLIEKQMASNVRAYGSGIVFHDMTMWLWYADRMGVVVSQPIDIVDQSELMLSTVAALEQADLHRLGICHLMHFDTRDGQFNSYENAQLVLDEGQDVKDAQGNVVKNALVFDVQLVSELQVYVENTLIGRGTTVIPIRATGYAATLFGRGRLVAKMAWHPSDRKGDEADCIRTIRRTLARKKPHMLKHIVALKCSMSRTMEEISLPRALMGVKARQERVFRVYVMQQYEPLHALPGAQEFKIVIIDVLRAHHWVYKLCRILHADISYNNVMFYFSPSRVVGVLCDWDQGAMKIESLLDTEESFFPGLADRPTFWDPTDKKSFLESLRDEEEEASISAICDSTIRLKYETGTGPFMAIDLLEQKDHPIHLYRHDLESFFWLIAYMCAAYDVAQHTYLDAVPDWFSQDHWSIACNKRQFLEDFAKHDRHNVFNQQRDHGFRALIDEWVTPLRSLFWRIVITRGRAHILHEDLRQRARPQHLNRETLDDIRTIKAWEDDARQYASFMKIICPRGWTD